MAFPKQKLRELVFQIVYTQDIHQLAEEDSLFSLFDQCKISKKNLREAAQRAMAVLNHLSRIDPLIQDTSTGYEFGRISLIEKNILRVGIYELLFDEEIPQKVAIAEAIRLERKFGTPEGGAFVNAVLDVLYQKNLRVSDDTRSSVEV